MWRTGRRGLYLEPDELAALADAARQTPPPARPEPAARSNALFLAAVAAARSEMVEGPGVWAVPAPTAVRRLAARALVRAEGPPPSASNGTGMGSQESINRIHGLAERAARVQDLLGDLEVVLLPAGETPALRLLGELKRAWRDFRDEAMREGSARGGNSSAAPPPPTPQAR